jgi:hypothetical protein
MDTKFLELNAGVFRRCLNGFFQTNFLGDNENIEALKLAISIEEMILSSGYSIDYYVTSDNRILRANLILPNPTNKKQEITIKEKFSHLLPKEEVVKDINYYKGKLAYNENKMDVGIITGYNPNNTKDKMRFNVRYAKKNEVGEYVAGPNAWNEEVCTVFDNRQDLYIHIENTTASMINLCNSIIDTLDERLNFLKYEN